MSMVSVVIPAFNRRNHVTIAIDSVLAQTYQDHEIIVVDDGSTDDTRDVLIPYQNKIRYFYQANRGIPATRNRGIKEARGTYVAFLDSDDYWRPDKLERQIDCFRENPSYGMVATRCSSFTPDGAFRKQNRPGKSGWILNDLFKENFIRTSSAMIKRECFQKVGLFDESLFQVQEYDLWLRLALHYPIGFINEPLTVYLDNPQGISTDGLIGRRYRLRVLEKPYLQDAIPPPLYRQRLASSYHYIGRHLLTRGETVEGRNYLKHALSLKPVNLKNLFYYIVSVLR